MATIDRSRPSRARDSLDALAKQITSTNGSLMIAPEGTRSSDGHVGEFKMGAFHLANELGLPLLPLVIRGANGCLPMGSWIFRPGIIEVEVLERIPIESSSRKELKQKRDEVRAVYLRHLGQTDEPDGVQ
jgi:putative phosphoserine phosphatase/1-acylglycerol-3-phosphate O-acyltransferase